MNAVAKGLVLSAVVALAMASCSGEDVIVSGYGGSAAHTATGGSGAQAGYGGGDGATGGGTATATVGGGAPGGSGAGGVTGPCDEGDCGSCAASDCALSLCDGALTSCANDADCADLFDCVANCSTVACDHQCHDDYPGGVTEYYALLNCFYCDADTCAADCAEVCPIEPPPDAPCDEGDCSSCASSDCTYYYCGDELQACVDDAGCLAYENCELGCNGDPTCIQGCASTYGTGAVLYYAVLSCMYCSTDTCSVDCGAYCPIEPPPDTPCDVGDCSSCASSNCAYFWCNAELDACFNSTDCANYETCEIGCNGDPTCIKGCETSNPTGATLYYDLLNCIYCDTTTCSVDCGAYCPIDPPPDTPCDVGDCATCGSSNCAYFWCNAELDACFNSTECGNYENCEIGCNGDPACIQGCQATYPTGATLYYDLLNCIYCDTTTCSVDCAPYCPIGPPAGGCDVGDCNSCINSTCALNACATEVQTCQNNSDCVALANCLAGCTNPGCTNQCENNYAAGQADYDAMMSCLMCSSSTCAGDCAAYCP
ncbi:MAG: hypothetical protein JRI23_34115 [Deltaproteobacteria bacterium]|nr:hypothetical protein [Deltaproteobacteria bacterium]MBW2537333.1 hypothetical protein [Deltaproteobacteria bacterium]